MCKSITEIVQSWSQELLRDIAVLLNPKQDPDEHVTAEEVEELFRQNYYVAALEGGRTAALHAINAIRSQIIGAHAHQLSTEARKLPPYSILLEEACRHVGAFEQDAQDHELEVFLAQAIILRALTRMKPRQRADFFKQEIEPDRLADDARIKNIKLGGPATTFAILGASQASGFGVYVAASTALGFVTHAVGITLPFIVYTGMSQTIAFLIGPAGWLAAGIWTASRVAQPRWKRMIPALLFISAVESRRRFDEEGESWATPAT